MDHHGLRCQGKALTLHRGGSEYGRGEASYSQGVPGGGRDRNQDTAGKNARRHTARRQAALSSSPTHVAY